MVSSKATEEHKVPRPIVFISHTHGDRKLAEALEVLVGKAFQEAVEVFRSTDPSPAGGIPPGSQPFEVINDKLRSADAVWVLATPASVGRPWVYWEAGIGSQLCPNGVVVPRVGLDQGDVPSPLGVFIQGYDGLAVDDERGMVSLLGKVANQISIPIRPDVEWLKICVERWLEVAKTHKSEDEPAGTALVAAEQVGRFEGLLTRFEAGLVSRSESTPGLQVSGADAQPSG